MLAGLRTRPHRNLAEASAGWSARHRRWAVLGWLVLVRGAYLAGGLIGRRNLTDSEMGNGQSGQATRIFEQAFPFHSGEQVLPQERAAGRSGGPVLTTAVTDLVGRLRSIKTVGNIRLVPVAQGQIGPVVLLIGLAVGGGTTRCFICGENWKSAMPAGTRPRRSPERRPRPGAPYSYRG